MRNSECGMRNKDRDFRIRKLDPPSSDKAGLPTSSGLRRDTMARLKMRNAASGLSGLEAEPEAIGLTPRRENAEKGIIQRKLKYIIIRNYFSC